MKNKCELFRFNNQYCDVFIDGEMFLFAECEEWDRYGSYTCKEFKIARDGGFIVSDYFGAHYFYLEKLEPAPIDIAEEIIASEERYTLECMANEYGYSRDHVVSVYLECLQDGDTYQEAFEYVAACMMEYDL